MSSRLWLYILYSVGLHVALLLVLGVSFALSPGSRGTPEVEAIQAVTVDEQEVQQAMERLDQQRNESASEEEKRLAELERQRKEEQQRLEELRQQRQAEAEKQQQLAKQRRAEERRLEQLRQEQQAREKARREAEEQRLAEQRQREAEQQAAAEEARRQAEAEAKRKAEEAARQAAAEEKARKERKEAERAAARQAAEEARARQEAQERREAQQRVARARERAIQAAKEQYIPAIQRRVEQNWLRPSGVPSGLSAKIRVRTGPGGMVLGVQVLRSSGNDAFDRSAALAARKAEPLPLPSDPNVAAEFRDIDLNFQPDA